MTCTREFRDQGRLLLDWASGDPGLAALQFMHFRRILEPVLFSVFFMPIFPLAKL